MEEQRFHEGDHIRLNYRKHKTRRERLVNEFTAFLQKNYIVSILGSFTEDSEYETKLIQKKK